MGPAPARYDAGSPRLSGPRARVLELLQGAGGPVSVDDVAARLDVHANTARNHLEGLVAIGAATSEVLPSTGRGRPARGYLAAGQAEPDARVRDYAALAKALALHLARTSPDRRGEALAAGDAWGREMVAGARPESGLRARRTAAGLLAQLGFDPQGDAAARTVRLRRCPLLDVARDVPEVVCAVHLGLVRGALSGLGADPTGTALLPFAEPGACVLRLPPARRRR